MDGSRKADDQRPARKRSESRQRTAVIVLRLLLQERDALAEAAHDRGITLSKLVRSGAMQATRHSGGGTEHGGTAARVLARPASGVPRDDSRDRDVMALWLLCGLHGDDRSP
jgi:hypothetical protein